jgi:hypothetical protein
MNRLFGILSAMLLSSCATSRLYPVCFYNGRQPTGDAHGSFYAEMKNSLRTALGASTTLEIGQSPDGRWLVAEATKRQNSAAAHVWPRIGCVGSANYSDQVRAEAACVAYVRQFVENENYFAFGNAKDAGGIDIWNESPDPKYDVHCASGIVDQ